MTTKKLTYILGTRNGKERKSKIAKGPEVIKKINEYYAQKEREKGKVEVQEEERKSENGGRVAPERKPVTNKLEKDLNGKPQITLRPLEKTFVKTENLEEYTILMQVYECGDWRDNVGEMPTESTWDVFRAEGCVKAENGYYHSNSFIINLVSHFNRRKIIKSQQFYDKQGITQDQIDEIKQYFEAQK